MIDENKDFNVQENQRKPNKGMKKCKVCGRMIAKSAKVCPSCGAKQKGKAKLIIGGVLALLIVGVIASGGSDEEKSSSQPSSNSQDSVVESSESVSATSEEPIEYTDAIMLDLTKALDVNAMNAEDIYEGKYFRVTGRLSNIDSDGKYISIDNGVEDFSSDDYSFTSMQCYMKDDEAKDKVRQLSKGDSVTVCGKITSVGEIIGYKMDINYIE